MHLPRSCIVLLIQGSISLLVSAGDGEGGAGGVVQPKGRGDQQPGTFPKSIYFLPPAPSPPTPSPEKKTRVPKLLLFCSRGAAGRVGVKMPLDHPKKSAAPPLPGTAVLAQLGQSSRPASSSASRCLRCRESPSQPGDPGERRGQRGCSIRLPPGHPPSPLGTHWVPTGWQQGSPHPSSSPAPVAAYFVSTAGGRSRVCGGARARLSEAKGISPG